MNKRPVHYLQTDKRWKNRPYRLPGESSTIGSAGCGPTAAAMLIETITGKTYTPVDACAWSVAHGYKAPGDGTAYAYFEPQFAAFGISCKMLNWQKTYGKPDHPNHEKVAQKLKEGYYAIALMGPGLWTRGGHFVVLWWQDDLVRINDPAGTKAARLNGDIKTFRSQVSYYWLVDARAYNNADDKEEDGMKLYQYVADLPYGKEAVTKAINNGYIKLDKGGAMGLWEANIQTIILMDRAGLLDKPALEGR